MPKPYLEWMDDSSQTQQLEIVDKVFIGRSCKGVDPQKRILVQDAQVSRDHAVISRRAEQLQITDRSKNGTWVNGTRLAAGASSYLVDGDTITLGEFSLRVFYPEDVTDVTDAAILTDGTRVTPTEIIVTNVALRNTRRPMSMP
jgi:predicted component of type VI protein secretion system